MFGLKRKKKAKSVKLLPEGVVNPVGLRSTGGATRLPPELHQLVQQGFPVVDGPHYFDVLSEMHQILRPDWYLEIGTNTGHSLRLCPGNFVSVDPEFVFENFSMKDMQQGHFLQQTSDDFFASRFLDRNGIAPNLGFLDGMHLFEFLLRDVIAFEKVAAPGAIAVLHDCLPFNAAMTARDWDREALRFWTGDVWKTRLILQELRPDLTMHVLDAYPTGLIVLSGFDPENTTLEDAYEDLIKRHTDLDIETYGPERYFASKPIETCASYIDALRSKGMSAPLEKGA